MTRKKIGKLSSNMEDYLEAIAMLKKRGRVARVRDISKLLGVETPSVTSALNTLSSNGLVIHERYGYVDLTEEGEKLAYEVQRRHGMLLRFLTKILRIKPKTAEEDACRMEHAISPETSRRLTKFIEFVETRHVPGGSDWLNNFERYYSTGERKICHHRASRKK